jgi:hypothetical protein
VSAHGGEYAWARPSLSFVLRTMDEDDETHLHVTYASHVDMNEAFRVRMLAAITAGLEKAPIGVVTTPGTKNPRYVPTKTRPLTSSQRHMELA